MCEYESIVPSLLNLAFRLATLALTAASSGSWRMAGKDDARAARKENRMISKKEGQIRMGIGISVALGGVTALVSWPDTRDAYAPMSLVFAAALGIWRTGKQSL